MVVDAAVFCGVGTLSGRDCINNQTSLKKKCKAKQNQNAQGSPVKEPRKKTKDCKK